jgi:addiction module RelE/StbE family toxin
MVIVYHKNFIKNSKNLTSREKTKLVERLRIFGKDEFNPILNNHALKGKYLGHRSINISGDLRALYKMSGNKVIFVSIGSHSKLYK